MLTCLQKVEEQRQRDGGLVGNSLNAKELLWVTTKTDRSVLY